jgi:hypothetical protein
MAPAWHFIINMANLVFSAVFTCEAIIKIAAMGFWRYTGERTNQVGIGFGV